MTKQKTYRVTFKDLGEVKSVRATNTQQAEEWALHQLLFWGKESDIVIECPDGTSLDFHCCR